MLDITRMLCELLHSDTSRSVSVAKLKDYGKNRGFLINNHDLIQLHAELKYIPTIKKDYHKIGKEIQTKYRLIEEE